MRPRYTSKPIGYVDSLAKTIGKEAEKLVCIANDADQFFYLKEKKQKPNGSYREIYAVKGPLKNIHKRINAHIIRNVDFPLYLQGSIKDPDHPRSDISNAELHVNKRLVIRMDITNFFPSITSDKVLAIWKRFFNFPPEVAQLLTNLTTLNGFLPQGAPTSPALANLVFWDTEPVIVNKLEQRGFFYSRYVDDVTISTDNFVEMSELEPVFSQVFGMFKRKGVSPNRSKTEIMTSGQALQVHKLNVNSGLPTMPRNERSRIRAAVKECEDTALSVGRYTEPYAKLWLQTSGRVQRMLLLHPNEARTYKTKLDTIKPLVAEHVLISLEQQLTRLESQYINHQTDLNYRRTYKAVNYALQCKMQFAREELRPLRHRLNRLPSPFLFEEISE